MRTGATQTLHDGCITCCCSVKVSGRIESLTLQETGVMLQTFLDCSVLYVYTSIPRIDIHTADQPAKRTGHPTTKQIGPVEISKKCMAAKLINATLGSAAHAVCWVFRAKSLDDVTRFVRNVRSEVLEKGQNVPVNVKKTEEVEKLEEKANVMPLQCLHVKYGCKCLRGSATETECNLHTTRNRVRMLYSLKMRFKRRAPLSSSYSNMPTAHQSADAP